jgi:hypothetical protein
MPRFIEVTARDIQVGDTIRATEIYEGGSVIVYLGKVARLDRQDVDGTEFSVPTATLEGIPYNPKTQEELDAIVDVTVEVLVA